MNSITAPVLKRIDDYCARTGTNRTQFGLQLCKVGALYRRIEAGEVRIATLQVVVDFLDKAEATEAKKRRKAA
jgi:hypothetical protein